MAEPLPGRQNRIVASQYAESWPGQEMKKTEDNRQNTHTHTHTNTQKE